MGFKAALDGLFGHMALDRALEAVYFLDPPDFYWDSEHASEHFRVIAGYSNEAIISRIHYLKNKKLRSAPGPYEIRYSKEYPLHGFFHYSEDMSVFEREALCTLLCDILNVPDCVQAFRRLFLQTIQPAMPNPNYSDVVELGHVFGWNWGAGRKYRGSDLAAFHIDPSDVRSAIALGYPIKETPNGYGCATPEDYARLESKYPGLEPGSMSFDRAFLKDDPMLHMKYIRESHLSEELCCDASRALFGPYYNLGDIPFALRTNRVCIAELQSVLKSEWGKESAVELLLLFIPYTSFSLEIKKMVEKECPNCVHFIPDESLWNVQGMNGWLARAAGSK